MTNEQSQIQELTNINEEFENYFNNSIIPQLSFDKNLILRRFSPPAMKHFNLSPSDIGRSINELDNKIRHSTIVENLTSVIENNEILEKEIQTEDLFWYQMNIIPNITSKGTRPNGAIVTFVDISSRIKDLKEQEYIISEYETILDSVSHDIKNGLTGMSLSVQLLLDSDLENKDEIKYYGEVIDIGIKMIKKVVSEIFETTSEKFKYKSIEELINIENILEDVKLALISEISLSNVEFLSEINASEIMFSRRDLRTIIYNLINNAIKFKSSDRNLKIHITTTLEDKFIKISVKDNGIGIESSQLDKVFNKHSRVNESAEGSGIGLFLIERLLTNRGGKVKLESTFGEGSEFIIFIKSEVK